ncbi:hypothetical protein Mal52_40330 [Symmachiella dynata]|uniref:Lumazine-binding domain protein n=1 Tax=Symmachiella dynata TaxID=2527995 RepID=A0A517ZSR9_9PLAN|nr:hypothetical protein [Symmachiella dynata]QDU45539.1 hypothetical protein Mal52_40330 [Symmachiella dynata]
MHEQAHGNIYEADAPTNQKSVFLFIPLGLFVLVGFSVYVYDNFCPPEDQKGNLPNDSVRKFLELVAADNYDAARKLFYGPSNRIGAPRTFEEFCVGYKRIDPQKCKISRAHKGKSGFWTVRVDFEEEAEKTYVFFGLKIVDGEWRMERGYSW